MAAAYCANMAGSSDVLNRALIGVDAIVAAHGVPSDNMLAMLFHSPKVCPR